jgi:hypothetical protein
MSLAACGDVPAAKEFPVKRSVGITSIAVLSLAASGLLFLIGIFIGLSPFRTMPPSDLPDPPASLILQMASVCVVPAVCGIATGMGLLRLKNWARISIIVFSVVLGVTTAFAAVVLLAFPFLFVVLLGFEDASTSFGTRVGVEAAFLSFTTIGVWWFVLFTKADVKAQFAVTPRLSAGDPQNNHRT